MAVNYCSIIYDRHYKLREAFYKLEKTDSVLFKQINSALDEVLKNAFCSILIPKRLIPKQWQIIEQNGDGNAVLDLANIPNGALLRLKCAANDGIALSPTRESSWIKVVK